MLGIMRSSPWDAVKVVESAPVESAPWTAPEAVLREANIRLGTTYPEPIVDHAHARARALDAFKSISHANRGNEP